MRVLFCHDHRFIQAPEGTVFSRGQFSERIVARYERTFDNLYIAGRSADLSSPVDYAKLNVVFRDSSRFLPLANLSRLDSLLFGDRAATRQLQAVIENSDAVIIRLPSEIGLLAGRIARKMRKPVITEVVGCVWDAARSHGSRKASIFALVAYPRMRRAVARSNWTLYVTDRFLQSRYPARGEQAAVSDVELPTPDESFLAHRLSMMSSGPLVVGMIAAMFNVQKRVDIAIRAIASAVKQGADLRLEVVGPGETAALQRFATDLGIGERVQFVGALPHGQRLFAWLDTLDAYVQTSFQEGLPRALIEAMSRALPALGSDVGGTGELLSHECLHKPGDCSTLVRQLLAMRELAARVRLAKQNFSRAKDFAVDILDGRRQAFWSKFCSAHELHAQRTKTQ